MSGEGPILVAGKTGQLARCLVEASRRRGFITHDELLKLADALDKSGYGQYLHSLLES